MRNEHPAAPPVVGLTAEQFAALDRHDKALALWIEGKTYPQIAARCGWVTKGGAYKAVHRAIERRGQSLTDELATAVAAELIRRMTDR